MKTGPQKYPGASTTRWYQNTYGGDSMESNVICWHSTEGATLPDYSGGALAPNLTAVPNFATKRLDWFQHFDFDTSSRALRNLVGGVQTNTLNVTQVEIVGTCDPTTHAKWTQAGRLHLYMPQLPDWVVRDLGAFARWAYEQHSIPLSSGLTFKAYPASYGDSSVRMTATQWLAFQGHCGHQHVPENDHGDPGAIPMAAILTAATGGTIPSGEDYMPTAAEVAKAVWDYALTSPTAPAGTDPTRTAGTFLRYTDAKQQQTLGLFAELKAIEAGQSAAIAALADALGRVDSALDVTALVTQVRTAVSEAATQAVEGLQIRIDATP